MLVLKDFFFKWILSLNGVLKNLRLAASKYSKLFVIFFQILQTGKRVNQISKN